MSLFVAVITWRGISHFKLREVTRPFGLDSWGNFTWHPKSLEGEFISCGTESTLNIYKDNICVQGAIKSLQREASSQFSLREGASVFSTKYCLKILHNSCRFEVTNAEDWEKANYESLPKITYKLGFCSRQLFLPWNKWIRLGSKSQADIILPALAITRHSTFSLLLTPDFLKFSSDSIEISINGSMPSQSGQAPLRLINKIELSNTGYCIELSLKDSACCS